MKNRIAAAALVLAFGGIALFLFSRQVGEVYLKSGKRLLEAGNPGAAELLRPASRYARANPSTHYFLAAALQKDAMALPAGGARLPLIEGNAALQNALAIRADGAALLLLGQNRALNGMFDDALEAYNAAFFLSQKPDDAQGWNGLRRYQPEVARAAFARGVLGPPLIIAYNHFSGYAPFAPTNAMTEFLTAFFKAVPPERWKGATIDDDGPTLKALFAARGADGRRAIIDTLRRENLQFLANYLEEG